jgi:hypothetical protein
MLGIELLKIINFCYTELTKENPASVTLAPLRIASNHILNSSLKKKTDICTMLLRNKFLQGGGVFFGVNKWSPP